MMFPSGQRLLRWANRFGVRSNTRWIGLAVCSVGAHRTLRDGTYAYLVEPDPVERRRLQSVMAAEADTVAAFENVETFLAQAGALDSGCLVASADLPRLLALLKWFQRRGVALPVIVLDRDTAFRTAVEIMRAGAADFIETGFDDRHLLAAVRKVAHRGTQRANGAAT